MEKVISLMDKRGKVGLLLFIMFAFGFLVLLSQTSEISAWSKSGTVYNCTNCSDCTNAICGC